ncbi:MAG: sugar phosphate isomerase/epimerase, partial [Ferruginibacter sp.]
MNTRRKFIQQSGLLTMGIMMNPSSLLTKNNSVGIQLYSVRDEIVKDPRGVIQKIAAAGYNEVEIFSDKYWATDQ